MLRLTTLYQRAFASFKEAILPRWYQFVALTVETCQPCKPASCSSPYFHGYIVIKI